MNNAEVKRRRRPLLLPMDDMPRQVKTVAARWGLNPADALELIKLVESQQTKSMVDVATCAIAVDKAQKRGITLRLRPGPPPALSSRTGTLAPLREHRREQGERVPVLHVADTCVEFASQQIIAPITLPPTPSTPSINITQCEQSGTMPGREGPTLQVQATHMHSIRKIARPTTATKTGTKLDLAEASG